MMLRIGNDGLDCTIFFNPKGHICRIELARPGAHLEYDLRPEEGTALTVLCRSAALDPDDLIG